MEKGWKTYTQLNEMAVMPTEMERKNEMPFNTFKEHKHKTKQQFVQFCY
jgi:hypothetical protein